MLYLEILVFCDICKQNILYQCKYCIHVLCIVLFALICIEDHRLDSMAHASKIFYLNVNTVYMYYVSCCLHSFVKRTTSKILWHMQAKYFIAM